jgi:hypothetical protein
VLRAEAALRRGDPVIARLVEGRLAPVDEETRRGNRGGAELRGLAVREGPGGVDVGARCEPLALDEGLARRGRGADDVGALERLLD